MNKQLFLTRVLTAVWQVRQWKALDETRQDDAIHSDRKDANAKLAAQSVTGDVNDSQQQDDVIQVEWAMAYWSKKPLLKPDNQLDLTVKELDEEFTRILNANNPLAPQNIARYSHKDLAFKVTPQVDHFVVHYQFEGYPLFITHWYRYWRYSGDDLPDAMSGMTAAPKKAHDQFHFSERAAQTTNPINKDQQTNTDPPPFKTFSENVTQWAIYDAYIEDAQAKERVKEKMKVYKTVIL